MASPLNAVIHFRESLGNGKILKGSYKKNNNLYFNIITEICGDFWIFKGFKVRFKCLKYLFYKITWNIVKCLLFDSKKDPLISELYNSNPGSIESGDLETCYVEFGLHFLCVCLKEVILNSTTFLRDLLLDPLLEPPLCRPTFPANPPRELHANAHVAHKHAYTATQTSSCNEAGEAARQQKQPRKQKPQTERQLQTLALSRYYVCLPFWCLSLDPSLSRALPLCVVFRNSSGRGSAKSRDTDSGSDCDSGSFKPQHSQSCERASPIQTALLCALLHLQCVCVYECVLGVCVCIVHIGEWGARALLCMQTGSEASVAASASVSVNVCCLRLTNTGSGFCADFRF